MEKKGGAAPNGASDAKAADGQKEDPASSAMAGTKRAPSPSAEEQQEAKKVRTEEVAASSAAPSEASTPAPTGGDTDEVKMGAGRPFSEDPYTYLKADDDQLKSCM